MAIDNIFGIHEQALMLRSKRTEVLASNLANSDTPGYQAKDFDFKEILSGLNNNQTGLVATNPRHITNAQELSQPTLKYVVPLQTKLDGNTVDTQVENAKFAENSMRYLASLRFLGAKLEHLNTAIKGE